jgi:hypothetical protein
MNVVFARELLSVAEVTDISFAERARKELGLTK